MKLMTLLAMAAVAALATPIAGASAQEACMQEFQGCMTACGARSSKALQDGCFKSCESKNNICAERVYGGRHPSASPVAQQPRAGKDALAKQQPAPQPDAPPPARR